MSSKQDSRIAGGYVNAEVARLYDLVPKYAERPDRRFYVDEARRSGGPVLELGCGTGRVLISIARAHVNIVGLDLSGPMLGSCRGKLAREPKDVRERVELVQGDMCNFDLVREFALVIIPFRPFQHLVEEEKQVACLRSIRRHLRPGGRLAFDVFYPNLDHLANTELGKECELTPWTKLPDGRELRRTTRTTRCDIPAQVKDVEIIYYLRTPDDGEERYVQAFPFRWFYRYEMEYLLARCGFRVRELYADFERTPFGQEYPCEMVFVAESL